jgi:hypothetical protein
MRLLLSASLLLTLAAGPAWGAPRPQPTLPPLAWEGGPSLATPTGARLFPRLLGEPMPGWLEAYGSREMGVAYEGYHEEATLRSGHRQVLLRTQGLLGAYLLRGGRCEGQLLFEPQVVDSPEALPGQLKRAGFRPRTGLLATRDRAYGTSATIYERRRGAMLEQYFVLSLPYREDTVLQSRTLVGAEACYPAALAAALAPVIAQGTAALAEFCRAEEQKARNSAN